ncbi:MAG: hypothetical protein M3016_04020 [Actinomycetota bacterium]|nr:hypothetical protein [Actinomycetota bacterium]
MLRRPPFARLALRFSWPGNSALRRQGFLTSPCQGILAGCTNVLKRRGSVRVQALPGG